MRGDRPEADFDTLVVRAGGQVELGGARPTSPPIHHASAFYFDDSEQLDRGFEQGGYVYTRFANPTTAAFERAVALLEGADAAVAFSSGMAALHAAVLACLDRPDGLLLAARDCYGGTEALIRGPLARVGVRHRLVDFQDEAAVAEALAEGPFAVLVETISNPLLRLVDLGRLAEQARQRGARLIVDNTFATPLLCRPLRLGADLVVHSATKYLGGHGDVTAGVLAGSAGLVESVGGVARLVGGVLDPGAAWLALRGLRTLALRMERQCASALELAGWLEAQPRVARVYYPGLASHSQHVLAGRLLSGGSGAVVSFDLEPAEPAAATAFIDRLRLFTPAPTVGDLESLVMYPARASHRGLTPAERARVGIGDGLVRLSIGIESARDLRADLANALAVVG